MRFEHPYFLYALALVPLIAGLLHILYVRHQKISNRFIANALIDQKFLKQHKRIAQIQAICLLVGVTFAIIALARPQWGKTEEVIKRQGLDILVAVDVSKSMLTQDVRPTRLERTQWAIKDLVKQLKGDRVGLMAFAGEAFMMCPLTLDYNGFLLSVDDLAPSVIPRGGTRISSAIEEAIRNYGTSVGYDKTLVIITDGEDLEGQALAAAQHAKAKGIRIFTVGVGTKEGDLIEITDDNGQKQYLKDAQGQVIKSKLDENLLQSIAFETGGAYVRSSPTEFGLDFLYEKQLSLLTKQELDSKQWMQYHERFQWPLTIACVMFMMWMGIPLVLKRALIGIVCVYSLMSTSAFASVTHEVNQGNQALIKGDIDKAMTNYTKAYQHDSANETIMYNLANGYYRQGNYNKAADLYSQSQQSKDTRIQRQSTYNLGNTLFHQAQQIETTDINKAISIYEQALKQYDDALSKSANDEDALKNKKITEEKIQHLKEKKQQQDNQQGQSQDKGKENAQDKSSQQQPNKSQQDQDQQPSSSKDSTQGNKSESSETPEEQKSASHQDDQKSAGDKSQQGTNDSSQEKVQSAQEAAKDVEKAKALEMLNDYQRLEGQQGMLYLHDKKSDERPVSKDW